MRTIALSGLIVLTGCSDALHGARVTGNSETAIVSNTWNEMQALPKADAHCKKFGKVARLNKVNGYNVTFDCVTPTS